MDHLHDDTETSKGEQDHVAALERLLEALRQPGPNASEATPEETLEYCEELEQVHRYLKQAARMILDAQLAGLPKPTPEEIEQAKERQRAIGEAIDRAGGLGSDPPPELTPEQQAAKDRSEKAYELWQLRERLKLAVRKSNDVVARGAPIKEVLRRKVARRACAPRSRRREIACRPAVRVAKVAASTTTTTTRAESDSGGAEPPEPPSRRPRPSPAAILVSQKTAPELFGWSSTHYIAFLRRKNVRHVRDGRLFIAKVADVLEALGLGDAPAPAAPSWSPDDVIAALRSGGRR